MVLSEVTPTHHSQPPHPRHAISSPARATYVAPTTSHPAHLSLNLRILAFSEAARTVPLEYSPHLKPTQSYTAPQTTFAKSPVHEYDDPEAKQEELLARAQKLYVSAQMLEEPVYRARYLEELGHVGGILAYTHPESSPMAKYLSQERREAVADQINNAILRMPSLNIQKISTLM